MNNNTTMKAAVNGGIYSYQVGATAREGSTDPSPRLDTYKLGLIAWAVSPPAIVGMLFGMWLDGLLSQKLYWMAGCFAVGVLLGSQKARHSVAMEDAMRREEQDDFEY